MFLLMFVFGLCIHFELEQIMRTFKWRAWLFDCIRCFSYEAKADGRANKRARKYTHYSGLGSGSVHLFSLDFNHRMINSRVMLVSISFNVFIVMTTWLCFRCYCCMTISVFLIYKFNRNIYAFLAYSAQMKPF